MEVVVIILGLFAAAGALLFIFPTGESGTNALDNPSNEVAQTANSSPSPAELTLARRQEPDARPVRATNAGPLSVRSIGRRVVVAAHGPSLPYCPREERIVVIDFETTGLSPATSCVIEVSARELMEGAASREFRTLVDPGVAVPAEVTRLTGITNSMLVGAPSSDEVMEELAEFIGGAYLVAHNASFEQRFLQAECGDDFDVPESRLMCTMKLSRRTFPGLDSYRLSAIAGRLGLQAPASLHRASVDTYVTLLLFVRICRRARETLGHCSLGHLSALQNMPITKSKNLFNA